MSARRGEVPFVAVPVGHADDEKEILGLAADLKIHRAQALGYWVMWKELMLRRGDARRGVLKDFEAAHIAARLGHSNIPKLLAALKRAGLLATQRKTFRDPTWSESITGQYAMRKAEDRETWARQKAAQRAAAQASVLGSNGADVHPMSTWTDGGRPPHVQVENGQKERKESGGHLPPTPPQGGGELASRRWDWLLAHHKRPSNPKGCMRILAEISEDDWRMIQWAWSPAAEGGGLISLSKKRIMRRTSYEFLRNGAFVEIRPQWVEKLRGEQRPKAAPQAAARRRAAEEGDAASRKHDAGVFLLQQLRDEPDEAKREALKRRWIAAHGGPGPWEAEGEGLQSSPPTN